MGSEVLAIDAPDSRVLEVDELLDKLEKYDARKGEIVRLRYFAGLTVEESAEVLGISRATAERELKYIRAWISRELEMRDDGEE